MKALVSPMQNNLVVQVEEDQNIFEVAEPLFWVDCSNDIEAGWATYEDGEFIVIPQPPAPNPPLPGN
jgi:hypothetical protein